MANAQISIKDEQSARQWLEAVRAINQDFHTAMKDAGDALVDMQQCMDGTLVDDYVKLGNQLLTAAKNTFDAIDKIADTVNKVLSTIKNFTEKIVGGIGGVASKLFG